MIYIAFMIYCLVILLSDFKFHSNKTTVLLSVVLKSDIISRVTVYNQVAFTSSHEMGQLSSHILPLSHLGNTSFSTTQGSLTRLAQFHLLPHRRYGVSGDINYSLSSLKKLHSPTSLCKSVVSFSAVATSARTRWQSIHGSLNETSIYVT